MIIQGLQSQGILDNRSVQALHIQFTVTSLSKIMMLLQISLSDAKKAFHGLQNQKTYFLRAILQSNSQTRALRIFLSRIGHSYSAFLLFLAIIFTPAKNYVLLVLCHKRTLNSYEIEKQSHRRASKSTSNQYYIEHSIDKKSYLDRF